MGTRYPANSVKRAANAIATTVIPAGAAPKTLAGTKVAMDYVVQGSLSAKVVANAKTNTLTITGQWQVSDDNSTWINVFVPNYAAYVVLATGTGSNVTTTAVLAAPDAVYAWRYARLALVSGVGVADGVDDKGSISYNWREFALL